MRKSHRFQAQKCMHVRNLRSDTGAFQHENRVSSRRAAAHRCDNGSGGTQAQTPRPVAVELPVVMPPGRAWKEQGPRQQRHGPYTQIQPASKKVKPQQECQRFKVQALSQLDAIANEGLRAVDAELTTMAWARNQQIWLRLDQAHSTRMHCDVVDNHGEPLLMSNQELYSVMVQITWTLKTQALTNMQVQWRPKSVGKWHPLGGDPPLFDGRGPQSGALLCQQKWRLHAFVGDGPS